MFGTICCLQYLRGASVNNNKQSGGILIMTVIFLMMLTVLFVSLSGITNLQYRQGGLVAQDETAFQIAEAGLNFARWRLAHDPTNFTPVTREVNDQLEGLLGTYSLTFTAPQTGSTIVQISSLGHTANAPTRDVVLEATYGMPSLAKYASLTNDDVWYKSTISGAVHSNGGIRMDGVSDSTMTSAKATYVCQTYHGCSNETKPGVWGTGSNSAFWQYPVASVDYNGLTLDLLAMKTAAQSAGTYFGPSGVYGYHLVLSTSNTYTLYRVLTKTAAISSYASDTGYQTISHDIATQAVVSSGTVPSNSIMYFEDTLWVDGNVRDRVTVAAGRFPDTPSTNADIIINGNISYGGVRDGSRVFGAVAQGNVLIPYSAAPANLVLEGAYVAQHGRFGRRYYPSGSSSLRTSLTRYGMIASNLVPATAWSSGGTVVSGYPTSSSSYDPNLLYGPPPFFPTSGEYQFLSWSQTE